MRRALLSSAVAAAVLTTVALKTPAPAEPGRPAPTSPWRRACGWIVNPTPANWWLVDRFGEWELGVQGGHQAKGLDDIPDLSGHDWQAEGSGGKGCVCLDIRPAPRGRAVAALRFVRQLPLKTCRSDPAIKGK